MNMDTRLTRAFLDYLVERELLNDESVLEVLDKQREMTAPIGRLALSTRTMDMKQVNATLSSQLDTKLRFGEQAIELGFINESDLDFLLEQQDQRRPSIGKVLLELEWVDEEALVNFRQSFLESTAAILL